LDSNEFLRPYLGGGLVLIEGEAEVEIPGGVLTPPFRGDDEDNGVGAWVGGGVFWRLGPVVNLGVGLRYSHAEITLFGEDVKAGGWHLGRLFGFGWPSSN